jgi:hypothetical protein
MNAPHGNYCGTVRRISLAGAGALLMLAAVTVPAHADEGSMPAEPTAPASSEPAPSPESPATESASPEASTEEPPAQATPPASRLPLREGAVGWRVAKVQERLQWLGYRISAGNLDRGRMGASTVTAVRKFQVKFGMRPTGVVGRGTWDRIAELTGRIGWLPKQCLGQLTVCIDTTQKLVRVVNRKGRVLQALDARFGFPGADTDEGTFRVHMKSRDHTSSRYRTWMPFAVFFSGDQAVHYSPYFARDGYNGASHGCVNLRDFKGAEELFDRVSIGTRVHVYRS